MKKFLIYISLFLAVLFLSTQVSAQIHSFSKDPKQFQKEIKKFYKGYKVEKTQLIVEQFLDMIESEQFLPEEYLKIITSCNEMLQTHHLKPIPHFEQYLEILVTYKNKIDDIRKFNQWDKVYNLVLNDSKREVKDFNRAILTLFSKNALYESQSKIWRIYNQDYLIEYDGKKPVIIVNRPISLTCLTREDTLSIHGTTGKFYPLKNKWVGSKGHVNWRRVHEDTTKVFAKINDYHINMRNAEFYADSVIFWNKRYFSTFLIGRYRDKAMTTYRGKKAAFPYFRSYKAVYILDKIAKNVLYIGGFTQEGLKIMGTSSMDEFGPKQYARVYVSYKGQKIMKAVSDVFQITPEKIVSSNSKVTIYYENDSFYHPKIIFNFVVDDRKLVLTRGDEGMYQSPMYDTYHDLEMEFDQMEWMIDQHLMEFRLFYGSEGSAFFTSQNYFTYNTYMRTQSVLTYHPLTRIKYYAEKVADTNVFNIAGFAAFMGVKPESLHPLLIRLTMKGFLIFDIKNGEIIVRDKALLYENAANNKTDYDFLKFESVIKKSNAVFSLVSGNLELEGIGNVLLSDTHRVYIYPKNQNIVLKKNRNFEFGGYVRAGLFEFFGDGFYFDYDNFKIDLKDIDSVRMFVRVDPLKPTLIAQVQSVLQDVSGHLLIDQPNNKSGRINYPEYPIFKCTKHSYVYYDKPWILDGNYDRNRFYFKIEPFTVDSLDKFTMAGLEFDGTFHSGGIMPVFDYTLIPQKDFSLGFTKKDNFQLYVNEGEAKGTGDMVINLSNKGLRGNGVIEYLTSKTVSEDFIFYLDSMRSESQTFDLAHNARGIYPKVQGKDVFSRWHPYSDTMIIEKIQTPFLIFEKEIEFSGDLVLTPEKLSSSGTFNYKISRIKSKEFTFTPTHLLSESASVLLKSNDPNYAAFVAPDANIDLDIITEITKGEVNQTKNPIRFPLNQYMTSMKKFTWNSIEERVDLTKAEYQEDNNSFFMSIKRGQDSLLFVSTEASYNLKNFNIYAEKIPYIASADAWIYPDQGQAVIEKDAHMQSLENAKIKTDTINFYHELYDAFVNVFGKYKYTGYANYDYIDKFKNKQVIKFYQIRVDEAHRTKARGNIHDSLKFKLHPRFRFGGYAELNGNVKLLDFDGYVKPFHQIKQANTFWFSFHNRVNPDSVYISMDKPVGKDGRELFTGIYVGTDSPYVYNIFVGKKKHHAHPEVFGISNGVLFYDDNANKFVYADESKVFDDSYRGRYYTFEDATGNMYAEGPIDFGEDIKHIDIKTAGNVNYTAEDGKYLFDIALMLDFPFDDKALDQMSDIVIENSYFKKDTRENRPAMLKAIAELVDDEKERNSILDDIETFNLYKPTKSFSSTLIFTDLKLTYNVKSRMFESENTELGLSSIKKVEIHKQLDGAFQITKKRSGTIFSIYFQTDENNFYFFKYYYGVFNVLSSDKTFNEMVISTASKNSAPKYRIKKASNRNLLRFKKEMNLY